MRIRAGIKKNGTNPNLKFIKSKTLSEIRRGMRRAFADMPNFLSLVRIYVYVKFDPRNQAKVRFLSMLLSLPVLGRYGRADKYLATPHSEDDAGFEDKDISREMYDVVKQLHHNAISHGFHPLEVNE